MAVHEENNQNITFIEGQLQTAILNVKDTALMAYFKAVNKENSLPFPPNDGRPLAKDLTYVQFCKSFSFRDHEWIRRKKNIDQISRMFSVFPSAGERFYIRMLLSQVFTNFLFNYKYSNLFCYFKSFPLNICT